MSPNICHNQHACAAITYACPNVTTSLNDFPENQHSGQQMIKTHTLIITAALFVLATSLASMPSSHAQTPDFNITATPREKCINPGEAASYVITISSTDGFEGNVELADTIDPNATDGPTLSPIPSDVGLTRGQAVTFNLRSEEHTSELQSRFDLVCRLLLEKKKKK